MWMTDIYNSQTHAQTGQSNYCVCGGEQEIQKKGGKNQKFSQGTMLKDHSYWKLTLSIPSVTHL
jgi:hypothetical protein